MCLEPPKDDHLVLAEGKTKAIIGHPEDGLKVLVRSKDDITAGDGAKHDLIPDKARLATATTCNVFRLLADCSLPVAFDQQVDEVTFLAPKCEMIKFEVVVRRRAWGSYLKRHPHIGKGQVFPRLVTEFYLKTAGKKWRGYDLPADDPLAILRGEALDLYRPDQPFFSQPGPFLSILIGELTNEPAEMEIMAESAAYAFLVLEKAWSLLGCQLIDYKVEFGRAQLSLGLPSVEAILLADVIDGDSWRVLEGKVHIDKQAYRDGEDLSAVAAKYRRTKELTDRFGLPQQKVILWSGSEKDNTEPFEDAFKMLANGDYDDCCLLKRVGSFHKTPEASLAELRALTAEHPDSVVIANVGLSNAAGPIASAGLSVPVISVPAGKTFTDVWSSLAMPSNVPNLTVLSPHNAMLAALQILALRNPRLYACLRFQQERRLGNFVPL